MSAILPRMKSIPQLMAAVALAAVAGGCVISVEAIVPEANAEFDARLLGTWQGVSDTSDRATVSRRSGSRYAVEYTDGDETGKFEARLGRLGSRMVLDVWPTPSDSDVAEPYRGLLIPGHTLMVVEIAPDSLVTRLIEADSLRAVLRRGQLRLDTLRHSRQLVLTSPTNVLRSGLGTYIGRPGALDKPGIWRRVPGRR